MRIKTREQMLASWYYRLMSSKRWHFRRDGKMYKSCWLNKSITKIVKQAKAENDGNFVRNKQGVGEWEGVVKYDGLTMIAHVAITSRGSCRVTFTKELTYHKGSTEK